MADFPTLSAAAPLDDSFNEELSSAGDLVTPVEAGYKITRRQFTRRTKTVGCTYYPLTDADRATLLVFIDTNGTTGDFNWTHPATAVVYSMRFVKIPKISRRNKHWTMSCELEEV